MEDVKKMKISKTQSEILERAKKTIEVLRKYKDFEDFFTNCPWGEQTTFPVITSFNCAWRNVEKWKTERAGEWASMESDYNAAINEQKIIVYAKTESVKALERAGLIEIVEEAEFNGGFETIKIL